MSFTCTGMSWPEETWDIPRGSHTHDGGAMPAKAAGRTHPLGDQLRFTCAEWTRGLRGVSEEAGARHFGPMNSIGWIVGHLAWQEQRYLLHRPQGIMLREDLQTEFAFGAPMSTPSLAEMLTAWRKITKAADLFLDQLTTKKLLVDLPLNGKRVARRKGRRSADLRTTTGTTSARSRPSGGSWAKRAFRSTSAASRRRRRTGRSDYGHGLAGPPSGIVAMRCPVIALTTSPSRPLPATSA